MNKMFAFTFLIFALSSVALAGVKVTSVDLTTNGQNGYVNIAIDGRSTDLPDIKVYGKTIEISIPNSDGFVAIFKNVRGAQLSANSLNGKAIVKATMPYEIQASAVDLGWKNSNIEVIFPRGKVAKTTATSAATIAAVTAPAPKETVNKPVAPAADRKVVPAPATNKISKDLLNEDYLNNLMKEEKKKTEEAKAPEVAEDTVNVKQAAPAVAVAAPVVPKASSSSDSFSFAGYAAKFTVFLAMVLGLFYGVVQLLKKGVFKKGKLSFLNNSQMIEVLSTTYVGPKRSLMIVKAHKQIFLVANSESGLTFLSEMNDTSGLIKEGEKLVTGSNFDLNLGSANNLTEEETLIKLKEDIMQSTPVNEEKGLAKIAVAKDIVKFSDELKKKAKKLRPIEFN